MNTDRLRRYQKNRT